MFISKIRHRNVQETYTTAHRGKEANTKKADTKDVPHCQSRKKYGLLLFKTFGTGMSTKYTMVRRKEKGKTQKEFV
jgi:hypothetical protein